MGIHIGKILEVKTIINPQIEFKVLEWSVG